MRPPLRTRSNRHAGVDTRPGQVLLLALLALAPVGIAFILAPLLLGGTSLFWIRLVVYATPLLAAWSLAVFLRSPPERRAHRASRLGALLDAAALLLWLLVLVPVASRGLL